MGSVANNLVKTNQSILSLHECNKALKDVYLSTFSLLAAFETGKMTMGCLSAALGPSTESLRKPVLRAEDQGLLKIDGYVTVIEGKKPQTARGMTLEGRTFLNTLRGALGTSGQKKKSSEELGSLYQEMKELGKIKIPTLIALTAIDNGLTRTTEIYTFLDLERKACNVQIDQLIKRGYIEVVERKLIDGRKTRILGIADKGRSVLTTLAKV
ncbi:hypothetical protein [Neptuniibacter sp. QD37_11]|uniref:hypothetical protein n=1 Tax=Neptuniibacter sp. QD37_11 TaxID=3398209 RepID=UPI0039F45703